MTLKKREFTPESGSVDTYVNRLGDTSAFVNTAGQLLLTRRGKTRMNGVGIVFEFYTAPL